MSRRIGWGIIGCGWIGTEAFAPAIQWSNNGRLVAVASRHRQQAAVKARETGAERAHAPYEALLADPDVEAVYIGLPNGLHEEWALRCAEAGKHVLCDKTLTMSSSSARRISSAFAQRKLRLVEAFMYRHHPQWAVVHGLLDEGAIGRLRFVQAMFCGQFADRQNHRWSALGGGALWDLTCYGVNAARFVARAEPVRVTCFADADTVTGVDATTTASLDFGGGLLASVSGSIRAGRDEALLIIGELGTMELAHPFVPRWDATEVRLRRQDGFARAYPVGGANHYLHIVEHFGALVLDPSLPAWPAEDGLSNVAACEAVEKSWRSGAVVALG